MELQHKGTIPIETIRLYLRRFRLEDASDMYHNWAGDPEVCRFLSWGPHRNQEESAKRIRYVINNYGNDNYYVWAIELKSKNILIGSISLELSDDAKASCEVGYCLGRQYWNQGIMTEALLAVMHFLLYEIGYQRITAKHDVQNIASGKVMYKAGMQFYQMEYQVGKRRDQSRYDLAVYEKYKEED